MAINSPLHQLLRNSEKSIQIYRVGGAVRDLLLGLAVKDNDWVVVGASPEAMLAAGFLPVGQDFPVFLHPSSHEEYALARTERKTAPGYQGFVFHTDANVTLEQDLARRDLTINAMAQVATLSPTTLTPDLSDAIIDPYQGQKDLALRVFRHITPAFREDPLRILRIARFSARLTDFYIAPETQILMQTMVKAGEINALVAERVWQEIARGLMEAQPSRMFEVLHACGALTILLPELEAVWCQHLQTNSASENPATTTASDILRIVDHAAQHSTCLAVRFACLIYRIYDAQTATGATPASQLHPLPWARLRIPTECSEISELLIRESANIKNAQEAEPEALLELLERCDALRKPERFKRVLHAYNCTQLAASDTPTTTRVLAALNLIQSVATLPLAAAAQAAGLSGKEIGGFIRNARIKALHNAASATSAQPPFP